MLRPQSRLLRAHVGARNRVSHPGHRRNFNQQRVAPRTNIMVEEFKRRGARGAGKKLAASAGGRKTGAASPDGVLRESEEEAAEAAAAAAVIFSIGIFKPLILRVIPEFIYQDSGSFPTLLRSRGCWKTAAATQAANRTQRRCWQGAAAPPRLGGCSNDCTGHRLRNECSLSRVTATNKRLNLPQAEEEEPEEEEEEEADLQQRLAGGGLNFKVQRDPPSKFHRIIYHRESDSFAGLLTR